MGNRRPIAEVTTPTLIGEEGGICGGGVSVQETLPPLNVLDTSKAGFDEHRRTTPMGVHGVAGVGVEGMPMEAGGNGLSGHGMRSQSMEEDEEMDEDEEMGSGGHPCGVHGCGFRAKSDHGLTRHMQRKHSMGEIRRAMSRDQHGLGSSPGMGTGGGNSSSSGDASSGGNPSSAGHGFAFGRGKKPSSYSDGDSG